MQLFIYMNDVGYEVIESKAVVFPQQKSTDLLSEHTEAVRCAHLIDALNKRLKDKALSAVLASSDRSKNCPFTGGGDIYLHTNSTLSACLQVLEGEATRTQVSP